MTPGPARIVVGVDGSDGSKEALRWAIRQAELTGAELDAVIAWEYPAFFGWAPVGADDADFAKIAEETLTGALNEVVRRGVARLGALPGQRGYTRPTSWSGRPRVPTCWWSGAAGTAGSPTCCSARSAPTACTMRTGRSP